MQDLAVVLLDLLQEAIWEQQELENQLSEDNSSMRLHLVSLKSQQDSKSLKDQTLARQITMNGVVMVVLFLQGLKKIKRIERLMLTTHKLIITFKGVVRKNAKKK